MANVPRFLYFLVWCGAVWGDRFHHHSHRTTTPTTPSEFFCKIVEWLRFSLVFGFSFLPASRKYGVPNCSKLFFPGFWKNFPDFHPGQSESLRFPFFEKFVPKVDFDFDFEFVFFFPVWNVVRFSVFLVHLGFSGQWDLGLYGGIRCIFKSLDVNFLFIRSEVYLKFMICLASKYHHDVTSWPMTVQGQFRRLWKFGGSRRILFYAAP